MKAINIRGMAFQTPVAHDLPSLLGRETIIRVGSINPLRAMTIGINKFISKHAPQPDTRASKDAPPHPTADIAYNVTDLLAVGTFAQIYSAMDLTQTPVAIKVVPADYSLLGMREVAFLRYLKSKCTKGKSTCKLC